MQAGSSPVGGRRILLVDDEPLVRSGTALMLDELGHIVVEASSGQQGLDALVQDEAIDLVVTDFRMPDMDGMEFIARAKEARPGLTTVMMTGYAADDPRFGALDFPRLEKPFGLDALEAALAKAC